MNHQKNNFKLFFLRINWIVLCAFILTSVHAPYSYANRTNDINSTDALPNPGEMVPLSESYVPAHLRGVIPNSNNLLEFDFVVDRAQSGLTDNQLEQESNQLIKYFLAALTTPDADTWVNLSPNEPDRIAPAEFGTTQMGSDLLAQDYLLKQVTASLVYPEDDFGADFWKTVRERTYQRFGHTDIPLNTFNKVWIVPAEATVYEHSGGAFVVESHLRVMLEQDYRSLKKLPQDSDLAEDQTRLAAETVREIVIPAIEEQVNNGRHFAKLRQIYSAMILAAWYKKRLKSSLLGQIYVDRNLTSGVDVEDDTITQQIYQRYIQAFRRGVYNYIREDVDPTTGTSIPRQYVSGGFSLEDPTDGAMLSQNIRVITADSIDQISRNLQIAIQRTVRSLQGAGSSSDLLMVTARLEENPRVVQQLRQQLESIEGGNGLTDKAMSVQDGVYDFGRWTERKSIVHAQAIRQQIFGRVFEGADRDVVSRGVPFALRAPTRSIIRSFIQDLADMPDAEREDLAKQLLNQLGEEISLALNDEDARWGDYFTENLENIVIHAGVDPARDAQIPLIQKALIIEDLARDDRDDRVMSNMDVQAYTSIFSRDIIVYWSEMKRADLLNIIQQLDAVSQRYYELVQWDLKNRFRGQASLRLFRGDEENTLEFKRYKFATDNPDEASQYLRTDMTFLAFEVPFAQITDSWWLYPIVDNSRVKEPEFLLAPGRYNGQIKVEFDTKGDFLSAYSTEQDRYEAHVKKWGSRPIMPEDLNISQLTRIAAQYIEHMPTEIGKIQASIANMREQLGFSGIDAEAINTQHTLIRSAVERMQVKGVDVENDDLSNEELVVRLTLQHFVNNRIQGVSSYIELAKIADNKTEIEEYLVGMEETLSHLEELLQATQDLNNGTFKLDGPGGRNTIDLDDVIANTAASKSTNAAVINAGDFGIWTRRHADQHAQAIRQFVLTDVFQGADRSLAPNALRLLFRPSGSVFLQGVLTQLADMPEQDRAEQVDQLIQGMQRELNQMITNGKTWNDYQLKELSELIVGAGINSVRDQSIPLFKQAMVLEEFARVSANLLSPEMDINMNVESQAQSTLRYWGSLSREQLLDIVENFKMAQLRFHELVQWDLAARFPARESISLFRGTPTPSTRHQQYFFASDSPRYAQNYLKRDGYYLTLEVPMKQVVDTWWLVNSLDDSRFLEPELFVKPGDYDGQIDEYFEEDSVFAMGIEEIERSFRDRLTKWNRNIIRLSELDVDLLRVEIQFQLSHFPEHLVNIREAITQLMQLQNSTKASPDQIAPHVKAVQDAVDKISMRTDGLANKKISAEERVATSTLRHYVNNRIAGVLGRVEFSEYIDDPAEVLENLNIAMEQLDGFEQLMEAAQKIQTGGFVLDGAGGENSIDLDKLLVDSKDQSAALSKADQAMSGLTGLGIQLANVYIQSDSVRVDRLNVVDILASLMDKLRGGKDQRSDFSIEEWKLLQYIERRLRLSTGDLPEHQQLAALQVIQMALTNQPADQVASSSPIYKRAMAAFDGAMSGDIQATQNVEPVGGIDFSSELLDLQIKRDDLGVPLPFEQQQLDTIKIEGFIPVIINVTPVTNVPLLLGQPVVNEMPVNQNLTRRSNAIPITLVQEVN